MLGGRFAAEAGVVELRAQLADFLFGFRLQRLGQPGRGPFQQPGHAVGPLRDAASAVAAFAAAARRIAELFEPLLGARLALGDQFQQQPGTAGDGAENGELRQQVGMLIKAANISVMVTR